jgi:hypothetical protein
MLRAVTFDPSQGFVTHDGKGSVATILPPPILLSLDKLPDGAWPFLLHQETEYHEVYFHEFLSENIFVKRWGCVTGEVIEYEDKTDCRRILDLALRQFGNQKNISWIAQKQQPLALIYDGIQKFHGLDAFCTLELRLLQALQSRQSRQAQTSAILAAIEDCMNRLECSQKQLSRLITTTIPEPSEAYVSSERLQDQVRPIRQFLIAWKLIVDDLSVALSTKAADFNPQWRLAGFSEAPDLNSIEISFGADNKSRPMLKIKPSHALLAEAQRCQRTYGRTLASLKTLAPSLGKINATWLLGGYQTFVFDDNGHAKGLRFDRPMGTSDFLLPDLYLMKETLAYEAAGNSFSYLRTPPFLDRAKQLFWRGSTTGKFIENYEEFVANHRVKACLLIKEDLQQIADCKITNIVQLPSAIIPEARQYLVKNGLLAKRFNTADFADYQMSLDLPGNASGWGAVLRYLQGMLVFKVAHGHELFYYGHLRPWVHYIPVASDLSDLKAGVIWALENQSKAEEIAEAGKSILRDIVANGRKHLEQVIINSLLADMASNLENS